jgi:hypothetical protein
LTKPPTINSQSPPSKKQLFFPRFFVIIYEPAAFAEKDTKGDDGSGDRAGQDRDQKAIGARPQHPLSRLSPPPASVTTTPFPTGQKTKDKIAKMRQQGGSFRDFPDFFPLFS